MKTKKNLLFALIGSVLTLFSASGGIPPVNADFMARNSVREQITGALKDVEASENEVVWVYFTVNNKKEFILADVKGENLKLTEKVKNELQKEFIRVPYELIGKYSIKVRFENQESVSFTMEHDTEARTKIAEALNSLNTSETGKVTVFFNILNNRIQVKRVEGQNPQFATIVENYLKNTDINLSSGTNGYYSLPVKF